MLQILLSGAPHRQKHEQQKRNTETRDDDTPVRGFGMQPTKLRSHLMKMNQAAFQQKMNGP